MCTCALYTVHYKPLALFQYLSINYLTIRNLLELVYTLLILVII